MAGLTPRMSYFMSIIGKIKDPEQRAGLIAAMEQESEYSGRSTTGTGDGFRGSASGEVMRAPWRGEHEMPGNFERQQSMGNSLAEDALIRQGLGGQYAYEPGQPVVAGVNNVNMAMVANAPDFAKSRSDEIYYSGPPDMNQQNMFRPLDQDPSGKRPFTKKEVKSLQRFNTEMIERMYGDRPFYYEFFGGR